MGYQAYNHKLKYKGGNSGIGLVAAKLFVAEGAKVVITGRNLVTLNTAAAELGANGFAVQVDATDPAGEYGLGIDSSDSRTFMERHAKLRPLPCIIGERSFVKATP